MTEQLTEARELARRALARTRRLIEAWGPRPAGSEASRGCADDLRTEAEGFASTTEVQDFSVRPGAFLGWIRLLVLFYLLAVAGLWLRWYLPAALLVTLGLVIVVLQFFFYREVLDPLFPRGRGRNVLASVEPEGELRGELMLSGHHDSARVFNFLVHQPSLYPVRVIGGLGMLAVLLISCWGLTILELYEGVPASVAKIVAGAYSVGVLLVGQLWWFASSRHTPGAGDNLASTALAWELLRDLAARRSAGHGLKHLRVTAASWDAEEVGLRGSRAWRRLRAPGAHPSWNLNFECLYAAKELFFLTTDINGTVRLSQELAKRCARILTPHCGFEVAARPITFLTGGTDAGETARAGLEATTLVGMPWGNTDRGAVYHTPSDTLEAVDEEAVALAIVTAAQLCRELDEELICEQP